VHLLIRDLDVFVGTHRAIAHRDQGDALTAHPGFTRATHIISARIELTGQLAP
jgi:hypothetical protein